MLALVSRHGVASADGVVLDVGVSSMQIDDAARGFSFQNDGPLDMRMDMSGATAADAVNSLAEARLAQIIAVLGEERRARAIARAIVRRRADRPLARTGELAAADRERARPEGPGPHTSGDPDLSGAAHLSSTASSKSSCWGSRPPRFC